MHGHEAIVGGTGWYGDPLSEPFQEVVFQNTFCDSDPQCYPSYWFPLYGRRPALPAGLKYAPDNTFSSDVEIFHEMDKSDDFAMDLVGQAVSNASSGYREICKGQGSAGTTLARRRQTMAGGKSGHDGTTRTSFEVLVSSHEFGDIVGDPLCRPSSGLFLLREMSVPTFGGGGDTTIPSPGRSPKQSLPGIGLYDPLLT